MNRLIRSISRIVVAKSRNTFAAWLAVGSLIGWGAVTAHGAVTVNSVTPDSGPPGGGTAVTIDGSGFASAYRKPITLTHGGAALTDYQVLVTNPVYDESGLVGSWHLDETGGTFVEDTSGWMNHGTASGPVIASGYYGSARQFSGSGNVAVSTNGFPTGAATGSIEAWVYVTGTGASEQCVFSYGPDNCNTLLRLRIEQTGDFLWADYTCAWARVNYAFPLNSWRHVVLTFESGNPSLTKFYVDGAPITAGFASSGSFNIPGGSTGYIGHQIRSPDFFTGRIDEVRVWSRVLSSGEAAAHHVGKAKLNYDDIRFFDSDGVTPLSFWREADGRFWVKVPSIPNGNKTIYVMYGLPAATSQSNGANTFLAFDDFNDGAIGGQWVFDESNSGIIMTGGATWSESSGILRQTNATGRDTKHAYISTSTNDYIADVRVRPDSFGGDKRMGLAGRVDPMFSAGYNLVIRSDNQSLVSFLDDYIAWGLSSANIGFTTGRWYNFQMQLAGNAQAGKVWLVGGGEPGSYQVNETWSSKSHLNAGLNAGGNSTMSFDDFRVRQYAASVPSVALGSEESVPPRVRFEGDDALNLVFVDSETLTAETPPHDAGAVDVTVINPDGESGAMANGFTYLCESPTVDDPPSDAEVCPGSTAVFTVSALGQTPFTYQWRKDDQPLFDGGRIFGATTDSLSLDPVESGDAGEYDVLISNVCGSTTSQTASLYVFGGGDCNGNNVPDECDVNGGTSGDCNGNSVPDECDTDCDGNGNPDECDSGGGPLVWTGPHDGEFYDGGNWDQGTDPGPASWLVFANNTEDDNRCIYQDRSGQRTVCSLDISATGGGRQIIRIGVDTYLFTNGATTILPGGHLELRGGALVGGSVSNAGNSIDGYGLIQADLLNAGVMAGYPGVTLQIVGDELENQSGGVLRAPLGSILHIEAPSVLQDGRLEARTLGGLAFDAAITNAAGAEIELIGGALGADGLTNEAGASISGFGTVDCSVVNLGQIVILADLQIAGDLQNDGTIYIQSGVLTVLGGMSGGGVIIGGAGG